MCEQRHEQHVVQDKHPAPLDSPHRTFDQIPATVTGRGPASTATTSAAAKDEQQGRSVIVLVFRIIPTPASCSPAHHLRRPPNGPNTSSHLAAQHDRSLLALCRHTAMTPKPSHHSTAATVQPVAHTVRHCMTPQVTSSQACNHSHFSSTRT